VVDFLRANPSLHFIEVTEAAGSTTGNGHAYFRKTPGSVPICFIDWLLAVLGWQH
jgi:hypothetical protein